MNTNYLPYVQDETLFTSGRVDVLPFNRHFSPEEQDTGLKDRLKTKECISAVFNWCLEGLKLYRKEGLIPPPAVLNATKEYQESSDKIGMFIDECLMHTGVNSKGGDVYYAFSGWCRSNGFEGGSKRSFFEDMRARGLLAKSGMVGGVTLHNVILGYELIDDYEHYPDPDEDLPFT
jgi:putative DNA primase/helicase